jgi:hypothetical protein
MLLVIGAMMALSIDVVTFYTARSEAQLAADSAALAAARVLANSGATSDAVLLPSVEDPATGAAHNVAIEVAEQNQVGGTFLTSANIASVVFGGTDTNPTVTVRVQKTDLPTYFARILGTKFVTVAASATAEAYNPTNPPGTTTSTNPPVAPTCVKPWLLPNMDPSPGGTTIFDRNSGSITNPGLLGWTSTNANPTQLRNACAAGNCTVLPAPVAWKYYPGDTTTTFQPPPQALPACNPALSTDYEKDIAGCFQTPIACNGTANIDTSNYGIVRNTETADAVNCLTHAATGGGGDTVTCTAPPTTPLEFVAGAGNPVAGTATNDVMVSDSLVTVAVFDVGAVGPPYPAPVNPVQIIGFVQLFLNPDGTATPTPPALGGGHVKTTVINMVGCGTSGTGAGLTPILGNGASPVAVRLISP